MDVSYVMDGAAGFMWSFVCTFIKIEIMELRDIITHIAEERSTTNLSTFCYREWHLLQKEIQIEFLNRRAILSLSIFCRVGTFVGKGLNLNFLLKTILHCNHIWCYVWMECREKRISDFICIFISVYKLNTLLSLYKGQENTKILSWEIL